MKVYEYHVSFVDEKGPRIVAKLEDYLRGKYNFFFDMKTNDGNITILDSKLSEDDLFGLAKILEGPMLSLNFAKNVFEKEEGEYKKKAAEFSKKL